MALEKRTLTNGLTVYNDHIKDARTNHVRMYVPYGSYHEQPGQEGIAHVFELNIVYFYKPICSQASKHLTAMPTVMVLKRTQKQTT